MKYHERVRSLSYFGGKQARSSGAWIAGLLPWTKRSTYVEPFGGMMAVLLYRAPVDCEVYNDANGDIVNWWRCVQECRDEFVQRIEATPMARAEFEKAGRILSEEWLTTTEPDLRRGHAVYMWLMMCVQKTVIQKNQNSFILRLKPDVGSLGRWKHDRVEQLAKRLHNVQLERIDGVALLERAVDREYVTAYVDPPYQNSKSRGRDYGFTVDYDALSDVLIRMNGKVAISGYGDEWNHLGWHRYEKCVTFPGVSTVARKVETEARVEVLWTNYDASVHGSDFDESMAIAERWRKKAEQKAAAKEKRLEANADSS